MTFDEFKDIFDIQVAYEDDLLNVKASEYADLDRDDRLHNFKKIAHLTGFPEHTVLSVLTAKHIVALYDYLFKFCEGKPINWAKIDEYIVDIRNYQLLLKAILVDIEKRG